MQLGYDGVRRAATPRAVPGLKHPPVTVYAGTRRSGYVARRGELVYWGGLTYPEARVSHDVVASLDGAAVRQAAFGDDHVIAISGAGNVYFWGSHSREEHVIEDPEPVDGVLLGRSATQVRATAHASFVLCDDGRLFAWGDLSSGALDSAPDAPARYGRTYVQTPRLVGRFDRWQQVEVGGGVDHAARRPRRRRRAQEETIAASGGGGADAPSNDASESADDGEEDAIFGVLSPEMGISKSLRLAALSTLLPFADPESGMPLHKVLRRYWVCAVAQCRDWMVFLGTRDPAADGDTDIVPGSLTAAVGKDERAAPCPPPMVDSGSIDRAVSARCDDDLKAGVVRDMRRLWAGMVSKHAVYAHAFSTTIGERGLEGGSVDLAAADRAAHELDESTLNGDLVLCTDGVELPVHRALLAARSPYFNRMLYSQTVGGNPHELDNVPLGYRVDLSGSSPDDGAGGAGGAGGAAPAPASTMLAKVALALVHFAYTDALPQHDAALDVGGVEQLLAVAREWEMPRLVALCQAALSGGIGSTAAAAASLEQDLGVDLSYDLAKLWTVGCLGHAADYAARVAQEQAEAAAAAAAAAAEASEGEAGAGHSSAASSSGEADAASGDDEGHSEQKRSEVPATSDQQPAARSHDDEAAAAAPVAVAAAPLGGEGGSDAASAAVAASNPVLAALLQGEARARDRRARGGRRAAKEAARHAAVAPAVAEELGALAEMSVAHSEEVAASATAAVLGPDSDASAQHAAALAEEAQLVQLWIDDKQHESYRSHVLDFPTAGRGGIAAGAVSVESQMESLLQQSGAAVVTSARSRAKGGASARLRRRAKREEKVVRAAAEAQITAATRTARAARSLVARTVMAGDTACVSRTQSAWPVHRWLVQLRAPVLLAAASDGAEIELSDSLSPRAAAQLLCYVYCAQPVVTSSIAVQLLAAADVYQLEELKRTVVQTVVASGVSSEPVPGVEELERAATWYNAPRLRLYAGCVQRAAEVRRRLQAHTDVTQDVRGSGAAGDRTVPGSPGRAGIDAEGPEEDGPAEAVLADGGGGDGAEDSDFDPTAIFRRSAEQANQDPSERPGGRAWATLVGGAADDVDEDPRAIVESKESEPAELSDG